MGEVTSLEFSQDDKYLLVASCLEKNSEGNCLQSQIVLWDLISREVMNGHNTISGELKAVSPHGKILAISMQNDIIDFVEAPNYHLLNQFDPSTLDTTVRNIIFSPDQKTVALALESGLILLWDLDTGQQIAEPFEGGIPGFSHTMTFSPNGKIFAMSDGNNIIFRNVTSESPLLKTLLNQSGQFSRIAFSPDGVLHSMVGHQALQWDLTIGSTIGNPLEVPGNDYVFDPKGKMVASILDNGDTAIFDLKTGELLNQFQTNFTGNSRLMFSPNGDTIASAGCEEDWCSDYYTWVRLWDLNSSHVDTLPISQNGVMTSFSFSPNGKVLAMGYCPERYGAYCSDFKIQLWDTETLELIRQLPIGYVNIYGGDVGSKLVFNHTGNILASKEFGQIVLWDVDSGHPVGEPLGGSNVVFSPDDRLMASIAGDGNDNLSLLLWDVASHQQIGQSIKINKNYDVNMLAYSPDGKLIAASGCHLNDDFDCDQGDNIILVDVDPESWTKKACSMAGRNLTRAEWTFYIPYKPYPILQENATCPQWPLDVAITPTRIPTLALPDTPTPLPFYTPALLLITPTP